jgi:hypothetical protein
MASFFSFGEDKSDCWNKGYPITNKKIFPFKRAELAGGVTMIKGQVYINSHG